MYAIAKKVARPPRISRETEDPRSLIRKNLSRPFLEGAGACCRASAGAEAEGDMKYLRGVKTTNGPFG
ncbi:hypothetical protein GCM10010246_63020 [Streptomyces cuspidosporus]|uniref:Uncharacterized protein n=1 Tax=Streptomyces cuspidosporus TaxID=66882 RepID=A0ABN3GWM2_9ACTN